ncbi:hypothetical protein [Streptomyces sp. NBC_00557]|uniref:hypothetical protein n=1 Tax=Streptomyces sp. NBC_00557 TaxID=2975776 RepID=UPI002E821C61|nr:hypothetical protein [Streptomyces sp. NBC_00557]WUC36043.1 hypothetical protein OG956_18395 [Streptomyces sp. NBC_00557]
MADDTEVEKTRARYGLLAVIVSNLAIAGVAMFGVWRLDGDESVIVGILTAAFTAVSSMTTAYLGIKAVANTAKSIGLRDATASRPADPGSPAAPAQHTGPAPATAPAQRTGS